MRVTFPHMGSAGIVFAALLKGLGLETVAPPPNGAGVLELGARYSPETACLPFKLGLGNFIQGLDAGADAVVTCGGEGPCRLGYYAEVQQGILRELGYKFEMLVVEPEVASVWRMLNRLAGGRTLREKWRAFRLAGAKLDALDSLERFACAVRPRTASPAAVEARRLEAVRAVAAATDCEAVVAAAAAGRRALRAELTRPDNPVLRVGLAGELYVMLEPAVNQDLVRRLGELGVEVFPAMLLGDYVRAHIFRKRAAVSRGAAMLEMALPYLGHYVGGHGVKTVGYAVKLGQEGYDGLVHVFPFTCMPEVVARNILPAATAGHGLPVLSLAFDEQTGAAGVATRLEAFVDLLRYRRRGGVRGGV